MNSRMILIATLSSFLIAGCKETITQEVTGNISNEFGYDNKGADHVEIITFPLHGDIQVNLNTAVYQPDVDYFGDDNAALKFGKTSCFFWWCWVDWSADIQLVLNVGPGDQLGMKDVLDSNRVSKIATAFSDTKIDDEEYKIIVAKEFNAITLENGHKWASLNRAPGEYDFSQADRVLNFAAENEIEVKGHALLWYSSSPEHIRSINDPSELQAAINGHIETVLNHYTCDNNVPCIKHWDVLNEISASPSIIENPAEDDARYRNSDYYRVLGAEYIKNALHLAREIDPNATLWINDYNIEKATIKSDNLFSIIKDLVEDGAPLDGIGFQSHVVFDHSPIDLLNNMKRYADLGLKVNISEIDVPTETVASYASFFIDKIILNPGQEIGFFDVLSAPAIGRSEEDQKIYYENYGAICALMSNCDWVTQWGVSDDQSWLRESAKALTFNSDYSRKNTYFSLLKGVTGNGELTEPNNGWFDSIDSPVGSIIEVIIGTNL